MARVTLDRNVKFKKLVRVLALPRPYVRGILETIWDCAHECGDPVLGSAEDVEHAAEWPDEPGALFEALKDGDWIDEVESGVWAIHDYWDHAPDYVQKRRQREAERVERSRKKKQTADNGGQRRTMSDNGTPPSPSPSPSPTPTTNDSVPQNAAGVSSAPALPAWSRKVKLPAGYDRRAMVESLLRCIEEVSGKPPDRERCATAAKQILGLWRALGKPPFDSLEHDLCLVAKAARECNRRLFARDIRAEGWDDGVDRSRSVSTLVVQKRWDERLAEAREWWDSTSGTKSRANPHNPAKHGMALPDDTTRRWCSHAGGWVDTAAWRPYDEGPGS